MMIASKNASAGSTPDAFDKFVCDEIAVRKKVFQAAGVKPD